MTTASEQPFLNLLLQLKETVGADRCTLYIVDSKKHEVWSKVAVGLEIPEIRLPTNRGVVGYVARTGRMLNLKDAYNDPRFDRSTDLRTGYRTKSMLTMAIRDAHNNSIIGVLQILNKTTGVFSQDDEKEIANYCQEAAALIGPQA
ncbi:MAG: GAF domain-containing protein [Dehalococcoidia bacterium]|nr:GAF domain-containing protein [Dehalococcoidia bacterium]